MRYKDQQESAFIFETLDIMKDNLNYPNDLENLIHFLRINAKAQSGMSAGLGIKSSGFSAAAKKTASFVSAFGKQREDVKCSEITNSSP